jgi:alkanesulfonate monooxygenase SsuD/methylene tetrahydromethanopterin reductase-like flavin-dependent oxidoreductase (luciferase family)
MLAKQAATVDGISGGRLIVGLGAGWNEREYRAFGFPFDRRVDRFAEALTIISTLLRDGRIDFDGEFHRLDACVLDPPPTRPGGPPLMIGSTGPRMLSIALPVVDGWNLWYSHYGTQSRGSASNGLGSTSWPGPPGAILRRSTPAPPYSYGSPEAQEG